MLVKKSRGKGNKLKVLGIRKIFLRNIEKERNSKKTFSYSIKTQIEGSL